MTIHAPEPMTVAAEPLAELSVETDLVVSLPPQEWCTECSVDDDPAAAPGVPVDIVASSIEVDVRTPDGSGPEYTVHVLRCGHHVFIPLTGFYDVDDRYHYRSR